MQDRVLFLLVDEVPVRFVHAHLFRAHARTDLGPDIVPGADDRVIVLLGRLRRGGLRSGSQSSHESEHDIPLKSLAAAMPHALAGANHRWRGGPISARKIPRTALTSRDDQPVLVKIVRIVLRLACVLDGGWKYPFSTRASSSCAIIPSISACGAGSSSSLAGGTASSDRLDHS